ncbi:MAG: IS66 family insertion sequence element accessory protein TnpB [Eggerthellaceae bacterium]|nr:IS66 family insertion sequence element accessory protein TnpB [Eggerthellaceae bacterium]
MNPFTTPDRLLISRRPQDMRAGIQRLAAIVTAVFGMDPTDGALYCFVSRDCEKMKLLRFETIFPKFFQQL